MRLGPWKVGASRSMSPFANGKTIILWHRHRRILSISVLWEKR